ELLQGAKDGADTSIYQRYQAEVSLFDPAVFFRRDTSIVKLRQTRPLKYRVCVLSLADQTVPQRDLVRRRSYSGFIQVHLSKRMFLVERAVVRCVRLDKSDKKNKWITMMPLDKLAGVIFQKFRL